MAIDRIKGKTTCLYRKWVRLGVEQGNHNLISIFHGSCLFLLCFHADWCASNCIIARNSFSLYKNIKMIKKAYKCSVLPKIPLWALVNIFTSNFLCVNVNNIHTCISENGSSTKTFVVVGLFLACKNLGGGSTNHSPPALFSSSFLQCI